MEALRQVGFPAGFTPLEIPVVVTQNRATHYF